MKWYLKALVQKGLSYLPAGDRAHARLQRRYGLLSHFEHDCQSKIDGWRTMAGYMREVGQPCPGSIQMEIGSGWYAALPICSYLGGAARIDTYDIRRHQRPELLQRCAEIVGGHLESVAELAGAPLAEVGERHEALLRGLREGQDLLQATRGVIRYRAPADARRTDLETDSVDWSYSNVVLQHVPQPQLPELIRESHRIVKPGRFSYHSINCGDNYAYNDGSINQLNYLRFSELAWQLWQNDFLYQNRLREKDFLSLFEEAGFELVLNSAEATEKNLEWLRSIPVHPEFSRRYTPQELCVTTFDVVYRKPR